MKIETRYALQDRVKIDNSDIGGVVTQINIAGSAGQLPWRVLYEVQWFTNGNLQTAWFDEWRLE